MADTTDRGGPAPDRGRLARIAEDPRYQALVTRRARFTWTLTGIMLTIFFGYILVIAFDKDLLARPIAGGTTSLGIPVGLGVILAGIALTAVYVRKANRDFDPAVDAIIADSDA